MTQLYAPFYVRHYVQKKTIERREMIYGDA